jgi:hypothetical protein
MYVSRCGVGQEHSAVLKAQQCYESWQRDHGPLQNAVKDVVYIYTPLLLFTYHAIYAKGYGHRIQNGSHDCRGPTNAQGSKVKPASQSEVPRATRVRDEVTQGVASSSHIWSPMKGIRLSQASYMSLDWEVSFTSLRVGSH